eukprot:13708624-Ditylum_brightwellii.AAC.1
MACANGYLDVIRLLLKHGADLQLANEEGLLPFQMNNEDEGVQAILKVGHHLPGIVWEQSNLGFVAVSDR